MIAERDKETDDPRYRARRESSMSHTPGNWKADHGMVLDANAHYSRVSRLTHYLGCRTKNSFPTHA